MTTPSRGDYSQTSVMDAHMNLADRSVHLEDYYLRSTQELDAITELACLGEEIDRDSRDWMLSQVDFIVETIGDETLDLGDELRSNLLQLLLAIANLNEQIRRQASVKI
jgi:hypothetical protein